MTRGKTYGMILKVGLAMMAFGAVVTILHFLWLIAIMLGGFYAGCLFTRSIIRIRQGDYDYDELD
jgi:hypothetical protein